MKPSSLIELSSLFEKAIDQIWLIRIILINKYENQSEKVNNWIKDIYDTNIETTILNIEKGVLFTELIQKIKNKNIYDHEIIKDTLDAKNHFKMLDFDQNVENCIQKQYQTLGYNIYQYKNNEIRFKFTSSSLVLFNLERLFDDFSIDLNQVDKVYLDLTILTQILSELNFELINTKSYKLFFNSFIVFKLEAKIGENFKESVLSNSKNVKISKSNILKIKKERIQIAKKLVQDKRDLSSKITIQKFNNLSKLKYLNERNLMSQIFLNKNCRIELENLKNKINNVNNLIIDERTAHESMTTTYQKIIEDLQNQEKILEENSLQDNDAIDQKIREIRELYSKQKKKMDFLKDEILKKNEIIKAWKNKTKYEEEIKITCKLISHWWKAILSLKT